MQDPEQFPSGQYSAGSQELARPEPAKLLSRGIRIRFPRGNVLSTIGREVPISTETSIRKRGRSRSRAALNLSILFG